MSNDGGVTVAFFDVVLESTAGYWKFCSLYDWGNFVDGSRSLFCGPTFKLLARP